MQRRNRNLLQNQQWTGGLFLLVPLAVYTVFFIAPNVLALLNSFYKWDGISPTKEFVWFHNYSKMLKDRIFAKAF